MFFAKLRNNMKWVVIVIAATFIIGGLYVGAGVVTQEPQTGPAVAEVNGRPISELQFQRSYSNNIQLYSQFLGPVQGLALEEVMYASLQDLILDNLVRAAATEAALPVSAQEIDEQLAELKAGFPDDSTYRTALAQSGLTEKQLKELLRDDLAIQKLEQSVRARAQLSDEQIESLDEESVEALRQAAEDEEIQKWLEQLRAEAIIEIYNPQMQARDHLIQGRYEEALELYKVAMVSDPFNPYLHVSAALVHEQLEQTEAALSAYEAALELNEDDPMLYVHLGFAYRAAEREDEAAEKLRIAGELNPWDAQLQMILMQAFTEMELFDDALEAANRLDELERLQAQLQDASDAQVEFDFLDDGDDEGDVDGDDSP